MTNRTALPPSASAKREALAHALRVASANCVASALVHDLSQPLTAINAWASACLKMAKGDAVPTDRLVERLTLLQGESWRATDMIREFRKNLGRVDPEPVAIDLDELLAGLAGLLQEEARDAGVGLDIQRGADLPAVRADAKLVAMAILILFRNSLDAFKDGGARPEMITIRSRRSEPAMVEVLVADNGPGLDEETCGRLFRPFAGRKAEGMGLGLAICRTAIEALGGRIWLERNSGDGTTFVFALPCAPNGEGHGTAE